MNPTGRTFDFDPGAKEHPSYEIPTSSHNPEAHVTELALEVERAYSSHEVNSYNIDPRYAKAEEDISRSNTYSQYETLQPRKLTVAEETNNLIVLRQAALDNKLANPSTNIQVSTNPAQVPATASRRRSDHVKAA